MQFRGSRVLSSGFGAEYDVDTRGCRQLVREMHPNPTYQSPPKLGVRLLVASSRHSRLGWSKLACFRCTASIMLVLDYTPVCQTNHRGFEVDSFRTWSRARTCSANVVFRSSGVRYCRGLNNHQYCFGGSSL